MSSFLVLRATSHHHSQTFLHPLCLSFSSFGLLYLTSKEAESLASALRLISPSHPCQHMHLPHLSLFFFTTLVSVLSMTSLPCSRDPHTEQHSSLSSFITSHLISSHLISSHTIFSSYSSLPSTCAFFMTCLPHLIAFFTLTQVLTLSFSLRRASCLPLETCSLPARVPRARSPQLLGTSTLPARVVP